MAYGPPSYQAASYRQLWIIVAPYISSEDLYSACLVCRQWNQISTSYLWGSPASHFGSDNDTVYLSLTRFKRLLSTARPQIRGLVHTLHIPPAQPELYDGPQSGWLRDLLDRLPSLQSLIVSNLSYFDHQSLQVLHQNAGPHYQLRLLDASKCDNTTASSLALALPHFPELVYLDLSGAQGSRSPAVLGLIGNLTELCVLKLGGCGLRDDVAEFLSFSNGLRSLDVSSNLLTERGIGKLLARISVGPVYRGPASPFARRYSGVPLPVRVVDGGVDRFVEKRLTSAVDGYVQIEEGLPTSFSHLYVASNEITVDGLTKLLGRRPGLQYVDCGSLSLSQKVLELLSPVESLPVEIISPEVFRQAFRNIRTLRIHHSVVTVNPFSGKQKSTDEQCFELHSEDLRYELDSTEVYRPHMCFELDSSEVHEAPAYSEKQEEALAVIEDLLLQRRATFESPDDVGSSSTSALMLIQRHEKAAETAGQGTDQPLVSPMSPFLQQPVLPRNDLDTLPSSSMLIQPAPYISNKNKGKEQAISPPPTTNTTRDILTSLHTRRQRLSARERHPGRFKPSLLPDLKTLILTDLPSTTRNRDLTGALTTFIRELAEEEEMARLEQELEWEELGCKKHPQHHSRSNEPEDIKRLQTLTLVITPSTETLPSSLSPRTRAQRHSFTKSSTEDADSELFMQESEQDFSFFREDDGGLLVSKGRIDRPSLMADGLVVRGREESVDVVGEVAGWRRERRRFAEGLGGGNVEEECLSGHWRGKVKVVRLAE